MFGVLMIILNKFEIFRAVYIEIDKSWFSENLNLIVKKYKK